MAWDKVVNTFARAAQHSAPAGSVNGQTPPSSLSRATSAPAPAIDVSTHRDEHLSAHFVLRALVDGFNRNDLLTYASAIAFQILTAIVPFLLFVLAVAALLHDHSVWLHHLAPAIRANV